MLIEEGTVINMAGVNAEITTAGTSQVLRVAKGIGSGNVEGTASKAGKAPSLGLWGHEAGQPEGRAG